MAGHTWTVLIPCFPRKNKPLKFSSWSSAIMVQSCGFLFHAILANFLTKFTQNHIPNISKNIVELLLVEARGGKEETRIYFKSWVMWYLPYCLPIPDQWTLYGSFPKYANELLFKNPRTTLLVLRSFLLQAITIPFSFIIPFHSICSNWMCYSAQIRPA